LNSGKNKVVPDFIKRTEEKEFFMRRRFSAVAIILFFLFLQGYAQDNVKRIRFKQVNSSESDEIRTLKSLQKIDDLYMITYYGDYNERLDEINRKILDEGISSVKKLEGEEFECSLFAAFGNPDNLIYGRNFDNPDCGVLVGYYNPSDGYASIGFSRINDLGFEKDEDPTSVPIEKRKLLLNSAFFTPDGMNECGVAVALAALSGVKTNVDEKRKSIFITCLVREILDHAKNIEEAIEICKKYNVFDSSESIVSHHLLISDPSGKSAIAEYHGGEWKVMLNKKPWQVVTNSPLYDVPERKRILTCWRYKKASDLLKKTNGDVDWKAGMNILKSVSVKGTQWSTICDMKNKEIFISLYRNYDDIKKVIIK
jgi:hypothetical protein